MMELIKEVAVTGMDLDTIEANGPGINGRLNKVFLRGFDICLGHRFGLLIRSCRYIIPEEPDGSIRPGSTPNAGNVDLLSFKRNC